MSKDMYFCHLQKSIQQIWKNIIDIATNTGLDAAKTASENSS